MHTIIKKNIEAIRDICKQQQVQSLYLFGSILDNTFNDSSDIDFLLEFIKDKEGLPLEPFDYFDLKFGLHKIVDRKVDLVTKEAVRNSFFTASLNKTKVLVYEKRD